MAVLFEPLLSSTPAGDLAKRSGVICNHAITTTVSIREVV